MKIKQCLLDHHDTRIQIYAVPLQAHQFTTSAAGIDEDNQKELFDFSIRTKYNDNR